MLRALMHHWRVHLAVVAGAAVAAAVLTGALLVGDSVRGSLRALTEARLGGVEQGLIGDRFFRSELASRHGVVALLTCVWVALGSGLVLERGVARLLVELVDV